MSRSARMMRLAACAIVAAAVTSACGAPSPSVLRPSHRPAPSSTIPVEPKPFQVAAPESPLGPVKNITHHCRRGQISGSARLRPTELGVDGVLDIRGDHCHLPVREHIAGFLGASGKPLDVHFTDNPDYDFPARNRRGAFAFPAGTVSFGFAWNGSWCGAPARGLRVVVGKHTITFPLAGPHPHCDGTSKSHFLNGTFGFIGDRVQFGPQAWSHLTSTVQMPKAITRPVIPHPSITFHNPTGHAITLLPTPAYTVSLFRDSEYRHDDLTVRRLHFGATATVPAHGKLSIRLPAIDLSKDWSDLRGHIFSIYIAVANVDCTPATVAAQ